MDFRLYFALSNHSFWRGVLGPQPLGSRGGKHRCKHPNTFAFARFRDFVLIQNEATIVTIRDT